MEKKKKRKQQKIYEEIKNETIVIKPKTIESNIRVSKFLYGVFPEIVIKRNDTS